VFGTEQVDVSMSGCPGLNRQSGSERIGPLPSHFSGLRRFGALEEINQIGPKSVYRFRVLGLF
jgi:hypothetical protein